MDIGIETQNDRTINLSTLELLVMAQLLATDRLDRSLEFYDARISLGKKIIDAFKKLNKDLGGIEKEAPCPQ